jgi:hypothetical protein
MVLEAFDGVAHRSKVISEAFDGVSHRSKTILEAWEMLSRCGRGLQKSRK